MARRTGKAERASRRLSGRWLLGAGAALGLGVVAVASGARQVRPQDPASELVGLWSAHRSFGPEIRGPLTLREVEGDLVSEIGGHRVPTILQGEELRFEVPGERGYFRGRFEDRRRLVRGHWVQPRTSRSLSRMASPVKLERQNDARWTGTVTPLRDELHFYLILHRRADGAIGGFLRNPEANIGRFYPLERVIREGDAVRFLDGQARTRLEGRYDPEFDRLSVYFPLNGGTYDFHRADDDPAVAFHPRSRTEPAYEYRIPPAGEGWETAHPEEVKMAVAPLEALVEMIVDTPMDAIDAPYIHGFLVARDGKLVLEEYFHGYTRHRPHGTRSASKSITTTLIGMAAHEQVLDLDLPVYETLNDGTPPADLDPRARRMTLRHLITMSSGLACDDWDPESPGSEDRMQNQDEQPDWQRFTLGLPMVHEPGEHAAYCSGGQNLAGGVLSHVAAAWLPDLYRRHFAERLETGRYHMNLTPTGEGYGGGGLYILPRDLLKLGQLYLDDGVWRGRRLLEPGWAEAATAPEQEIGDEGYGYGWWVFSYPFGGRDVKAFYAGGNGGQYVIVVPELGLNVVIFAGNYNQRVMHRPKYEYVRDYVLRSIEDAR